MLLLILTYLLFDETITEFINEISSHRFRRFLVHIHDQSQRVIQSAILIEFITYSEVLTVIFSVALCLISLLFLEMLSSIILEEIENHVANQVIEKVRNCCTVAFEQLIALILLVTIYQVAACSN